MKSQDILKKIATLLNVKVALEQQALEDGRIIEADSFTAGSTVNLIDGETTLALPIGEYTLTDGSTVVVVEEGIIAEVKAKAEEVEEEVEAEEVPAEEVPTEKTQPTVEEIIQAVVDVVKPMIDDLQAQISAIGKTSEETKQEMSKVTVKAFKHSPESKQEQKAKRNPANLSSTEGMIMARLSEN